MAYAAAVLRRCDELAAFSEEDGRLTRRFGTSALWGAGEAVREWMEAAGMTVRRDAIGNLIGRLGEDRRTLLLGSHLDTVRDAGRYDGMLFVRCAGGVSHHPAESVTVEDVAAAIEASARFLELVE